MKCQLNNDKRNSNKNIFKSRDLNVPSFKQTNLQSHYFSHKEYPIPRGETAYCEAKRAEYQEKNYEKALYFYDLAIKENDRRCSAVKDMAGLLHAQGKTQEAIELMEKYESEFVEEKEKFLNLLGNLKKQQIPTGNAANKLIKISKIPQKCNNSFFVRSLFKEGQKRISKIENFLEQNYAVVWFNSHSGARKSLEAFTENQNLELEWMSADGQTKGIVILNRKNSLSENHQSQGKLVQPIKASQLQSSQLKPTQVTGYKLPTKDGPEIKNALKQSKSIMDKQQMKQKLVQQGSQQKQLQQRNKIGFCYLFSVYEKNTYFIAVDESWNKENIDENQAYCQDMHLNQLLSREIIDFLNLGVANQEEIGMDFYPGRDISFLQNYAGTHY